MRRLFCGPRASGSAQRQGPCPRKTDPPVSAAAAWDVVHALSTRMNESVCIRMATVGQPSDCAVTASPGAALTLARLRLGM
jgi:hypothetical protein